MSPIPPDCSDCTCSGSGDCCPPGGEAGQFLGKLTSADGDVAWMYAPYTNFIYNSAGTQSGNRFNTWSDLYSVLQSTEGPKHIYFEQDETLPAGVYDLNNVSLHGISVQPRIVITLPTGFVVTDWNLGGVYDELNVISTSNTYIWANATGIFELDQGGVGATSFQFFYVPAGGFFVPVLRDGGIIANVGNAVIEIDAAAGFTGVSLNGIAAGINDDVIVGTAGVFVRLIQSVVADISTGGLQPQFLGTYTDLYFTNAALLAYDNSIVGLLTATNVQAALDELAGLV